MKAAPGAKPGGHVTDIDDMACFRDAQTEFAQEHDGTARARLSVGVTESCLKTVTESCLKTV